MAEAVVRDYHLPEGTFARSGKINGAASPAGEQANRSYADHLRAMGEPHEMLDAQPETVTVSATNGMASYWLKPLIDSYRVQHPTVGFVILA